MYRIMFYSFVIFGILLSGCSNNSQEATQISASKKPNNILQFSTLEADELKATISTGEDLKMKDLKFDKNDKIILLVFFQTTCPPCVAEIPHLINIQNEYKDTLKIYGVYVGRGDIDELKNFNQKYQVNYATIINGDLQRLVSGVCDVTGTPEIYIYDKDGKYIKRYLGAVPQEMLENDIDTILGKK